MVPDGAAIHGCSVAQVQALERHIFGACELDVEDTGCAVAVDDDLLGWVGDDIHVGVDDDLPGGQRDGVRARPEWGELDLVWCTKRAICIAYGLAQRARAGVIGIGHRKCRPEGWTS